MDKFSYISNADVSSIEHLYQQFLSNPDSVDSSWKNFFEGIEFARTNYESQPQGSIPENVQKEFRVINLINGYRNRGHLFTKTNPVRERRKYSPNLDIENFGLSASDLEVTFQAGNEIGIGPAKLKDIIAHLQQTYCQSIGVEYMYIRDPEKIKWLQQKLETNKNTPNFTPEEKKQILGKLTQAVVLEKYLGKKFVGQKRFSLEGGEALLPALDTIIKSGSQHGIKDFVVGMAHRGRLNVLANIFNKNVSEIFNEFEGIEYEDENFDGDVKYHLGFSRTIADETGNQINLTLAPNPSHLEAVDPVVEGMARAKIDNDYSKNNQNVLPILIHGDAAIAAQGVVYEVIQMAKLKGYQTGGTIHIVVNNQVGFTTNYLDARSSTYCTDVGKVTLSPVFHVNGDDVEAMVHTCLLAIEYRQRYNSDVFIDLLCYRKHGHNEGDEPRFTQPILYKIIEKHPDPRQIYNKKLVEEKIIDEEFAKTLEADYTAFLDNAYEASKKEKQTNIEPFLKHLWKNIPFAKKSDFDQSPETKVEKAILKDIATILNTSPENKNIFKKMQKILQDRLKMIEEEQLDWAICEQLAYATLINEGHNVRLSGQDSERGTFSHRHAVLKIEDSEEEYVPLANMGKYQNARFEVYNSLLSEYGVLGYEYGYALANPYGLTIWEAQFGDFNNGAQIIIDQYLSSAEDKWHIQNNLVLLLPHGYEGMGAEHSSARVERFLTLCAEENMQVVNCTTPANFFHVIRRQLKWPFRKPLVVMTPKSLLRHPRCISSLNDLATGKFQEVIDDVQNNPKNIDTVLMCSGKIYYELLEKKEQENLNNIAIVRLEQLYPFPDKQLKVITDKYQNAKVWKWVQEEPENMGAWAHMQRFFKFKPLELISPKASASPASGSIKRAAQRQTDVINRAFSLVLVK